MILFNTTVAQAHAHSHTLALALAHTHTRTHLHDARQRTLCSRRGCCWHGRLVRDWCIATAAATARTVPTRNPIDARIAAGAVAAATAVKGSRTRRRRVCAGAGGEAVL